MKRKHDKPVDALFINPPSPDGFIYIRDINRHGRSSWERMVWPQTNLAYLAAIAGRNGLTVDIVDCIAEGISWKRFGEILRECKPRYCFSNIISATYTNDLRALRLAKETLGALTVGMGPHITDRPGPTLRDAEGLDFVITHEAEASLEELLQVFEADPHPSLARLKAIKGIGFIPGRLVAGESLEPVVTEQRPFIEDLDSLPRPRHDLLPLDKYWAPFLGHYTFVEASRGCAYRCIFCRQAVMWQWKYRKRSGKALAEEALYVHSLGVDNLLFHADTFTLDRNLVEELCDELIARGSPIRWACNTHVLSLFNAPDLIPRMKKAGCWMIAVGIESGNNEILRTIKKQITVEQARDVVRQIHGAGIQAWGYFVLGFPGETRQTLQETVDFALSLPLKIAKFDIAAPYPGTEFYRYAKAQGYLRAEAYEEFDQNASPVVEYPNLSRQEIRAAARRGTWRFYLRPAPLLMIAREMLKPTSFVTLIRIVCDQVRLLSGKRHPPPPASSNRSRPEEI